MKEMNEKDMTEIATEELQDEPIDGPSKAEPVDEKEKHEDADVSDSKQNNVTSSTGRRMSIGDTIKDFSDTINKSFFRIGDTQLPVDVCNSVKAIVENPVIDGASSVESKVVELEWGVAVDGLVERHGCNMHGLTVSADMAANGYIIHCRSVKNDKFKLALFDAKTGLLINTLDSEKAADKAFTSATMYFTSFDVYHLHESAFSGSILSAGLGTEDTSMFNRLERFHMCKQQGVEGTFIVCVVGDNYIGRSTYSLSVAASHNKSSEALRLSDDSLLVHKINLHELRAKYLKAKEVYVAVCNEMKADNSKLETVMREREVYYREFLDSSIRHTNPGSSNDNIVEGVDVEVDRRPSLTATTAAMQAASTATAGASAASGWMSRRLSMGYNQLKSMRSSYSAPPGGDAADGVGVVTANEAKPIDSQDIEGPTIAKSGLFPVVESDRDVSVLTSSVSKAENNE